MTTATPNTTDFAGTTLSDSQINRINTTFATPKNGIGYQVGCGISGRVGWATHDGGVTFRVHCSNMKVKNRIRHDVPRAEAIALVIEWTLRGNRIC